MEKFDVVIIGAGSAGYVAGIRLAQLGKQVAVIEEDKVGGTCLNYGCIPTKALLTLTERLAELKSLQRAGVTVKSIEIDRDKVKRWKETVSMRLRKGVEALLKANGAKLISGRAELLGNDGVKVKTSDGVLELKADSIIVATGSETMPIPGIEFDHERILTSRDMLELPDFSGDGHLVIVGAGAIGLEFATIYARLGVKITVVEMMGQVLPGFDSEIADVVHKLLKRQGIKVHLGTKVEGVNFSADGKVVVKAQKGSSEPFEIEGDKVLIAIGRRPRSRGFGLESLGVELDRRGYVQVNERFETNVPNIYAIGDVAGAPLLAHKAHKEGIAVAEVIAGIRSGDRPKVIPAAIFMMPEIATVGMTEDEAKAQGIEVAIGRFPFSANGRAVTMGIIDGLVKIVAERGTGRILGAHMVGADVSNMVSELALAIEHGLTVEQLGRVVHPHPTLSEAIMEAAENALHKAIHILNR